LSKPGILTWRKIYAIAKLSPSFAQWPFRQVLEDHSRDAPDNVAAFNARVPSEERDRPRMLFDSAINCVACHQQ
jgi:hypothetical protein